MYAIFFLAAVLSTGVSTSHAKPAAPVPIPTASASLAAAAAHPADMVADIAKGVGLALVGAIFGVAGTTIVNRRQNLRRDRGVEGQIHGLLDVFERHFRDDDGLRKLPKERLEAFDDLFDSAYSTETAVALKALNRDIPALYATLADLRSHSQSLAAISAEYDEFEKLYNAEHFYQTGPDKIEAFKNRHRAYAEVALKAIAAGRNAMAAMARSEIN